MQIARIAHGTRLVSPHGVLTLNGYGIRVTVDRGHLVVADGICEDRRQMRFHRATCGLRRLVLLGHTGIISLEALRWLRGIGAAVVQIDADGEVVMASGRAGTADAHLLRAQTTAAQNGVGLRVAKELLRQKLEGQAAVLDSFSGTERAAGEIRRVAEHKLQDAVSVEQLRVTEAQAAGLYWRAWETVPMRFGKRDERDVPAHWRHFGPRHSTLTSSPRNAITPGNCVANYLYAVAETETLIAIEAVAMAPHVGFLHADQRSRDSLVFDLLETIRPQVDRFMLDLLQTHTFAKSDFVETREGVCRALPPLTNLLAETAPRWGQAIAPVVERVAKLLLQESRSASQARRPLPTPLTQSNRSAGRHRMRRRARKTAAPVLTIPSACRNCGVLLDHASRLFCDDCAPQQRAERGMQAAAAGRAVLARLRETGEDKAHGGRAARARGETISRHNRERAQWQGPKTSIDLRFVREKVLPSLRDVPLRKIARALGISESYASFIRRGIRTPHPRHWQHLRTLVSATA